MRTRRNAPRATRSPDRPNSWEQVENNRSRRPIKADRLESSYAARMSIHPEIADRSKVAETPILPVTKWEPAHDSGRAGDRPVKLIRPPSLSVRTVLTGLRTLTQYSDLLYTLSLFRLHVR